MTFESIASGFEVVWKNLDYLLWGRFPEGPLEGVALTLLISLISIFLSTLLGIIAGVGLVTLKGKLRQLLVLILGFLRAIPILMLIFWTYFLLPILFEIDIPAISTVILALTLIGGAYIAYVIYSGMIAITKEQWQAAYSLGLNRKQVITFVILPQVIRMMMPSLVNQWVSLIKDTSLAYIVSVPEFTFLATQINGQSRIYPMEIFLFVIIVYFLICFSLDRLVNLLSKRYARF